MAQRKNKAVDLSKSLPNLPYGEGSMSYVSYHGETRIRYRKQIGPDNKKSQ